VRALAPAPFFPRLERTRSGQYHPMSDHDSDDLPDGELLPAREVMSLLDPAATGGGLPGTSGLLGGTDPSGGGVATPDPSQTPAHGIGDNALQQAQTTPGTSAPHVESTAKS
jgi:hypothetical protein